MEDDFKKMLMEMSSEEDLSDATPSRSAHCAGETPVLLGYALMFMQGIDPAMEEAHRFVCWLARNRNRFGIERALFTATEVSNRNSDAPPPVGRQRWRRISAALTTRLAEMTPSGVVVDGLATVCAALGFDTLDAALFGIIFRYRHDNAVERLFNIISTARNRSIILRRYPENFALLTGAPLQEVARRFQRDAPLCASGAISVYEGGDIHISGRVRMLVYACGETGDDMRSLLLGAPVAAKLPWEAFRHLGAEIEIARDLLSQTLAAKPNASPEHGVHILLYGPPGTGKTELSAAIAATLGVRLHVLGEQGESGSEPSRLERLSDLLLAQRVNSNKPVLYLFDEAEDLFRPPTKERETDPKIFIHRLLETAQVPMIWAANDLHAFSPAVLRRMSMCIEVKLPEATRRAELWQELAAAEGVVLAPAMAQHLARMIPAAPSVARTALRATRLAGGDSAVAGIVARGMARAIGHGHLPTPELARLEEHYDPALSRTDIDLADLVRRLSRPDSSRAVSLLLSGPPGTGKSAFARHLAEKMGMTVLHKRGSDIFGKYVGETEKNIANAFTEAREGQKFLIFDEADSLLAGRERAMRSWEVSQVNEMLTWMECHPLPFACTTNLPEGLDAASLRRFLIRANFDFLSPVQSARLFKAAFKAESPPRLATLDRLTPADFTRIARRLDILGKAPSEQELVTLLEAEAEGRDGKRRGIGFAARAA